MSDASNAGSKQKTGGAQATASVYKPQNLTAKSGSLRRMRSMSAASRPASPAPTSSKTEAAAQPRRVVARARTKVAPSGKDIQSTKRSTADQTKPKSALESAKNLLNRSQDTEEQAAPEHTLLLQLDNDSNDSSGQGLLPPATASYQSPVPSYHSGIPPPFQAQDGASRGGSGYQMEIVDIETRLTQLDEMSYSLEELGQQQIHNTVRAMDDIYSGVWAGSFFSAFASARLLLLCLCGQLMLLVATAFMDRALIFPGWICFALGAAAVAVGYPAWWEPRSDNHARLHICMTALSAIITFIICMTMARNLSLPSTEKSHCSHVMKACVNKCCETNESLSLSLNTRNLLCLLQGDQFCDSPGHPCEKSARSKITGVYSSLAAIQGLAVLFAMRAAREAAAVDWQTKAMLYKWKSDAVAGVFSTVGTIPGFGGQGYQSQLDHHKDSEKQADNDDDDEDDNTPNPVFRDDDLNNINKKIQDLHRENKQMQQTQGNLTELLKFNKKMMKLELTEKLTLVQKCQQAGEDATYCHRKLDLFERDLQRIEPAVLEQTITEQQAKIDFLIARVEQLEANAHLEPPDQGGNRSRTPRRGRVAMKGMMGASHAAQAMGFDTTGDGKVDALDTTGDGMIDTYINP